MVTHSPRAFPWEQAPPVGTCQGTRKHNRSARARRPRSRSCLRKGCKRKYKPRCRIQRYCQEPECRRQVRRWQAARRQAKRRRDDYVRAQHAEAEKERRQQTKVVSQAVEDTEVTPARGHADEFFFSLPLCDRPGCHERPMISVRNRAHYCSPACRQAVRNVKDRERKWLVRGTRDGRKKRSFEYEVARQRRIPRRDRVTNPSPLRAPPD
jgi:hypothetical protein